MIDKHTEREINDISMTEARENSKERVTRLICMRQARGCAHVRVGKRRSKESNFRKNKFGKKYCGSKNVVQVEF